MKKALQVTEGLLENLGATYQDRTGDTRNHNPVLYRLS